MSIRDGLAGRVFSARLELWSSQYVSIFMGENQYNLCQLGRHLVSQEFMTRFHQCFTNDNGDLSSSNPKNRNIFALAQVPTLPHRRTRDE